MQIFPTIETTFLLKGPVGDLEVLATPRDEHHQRPAVAVICHPHPLHGGTMKNKVVSTLTRAFKDLGLATVRFNFRGVGKSAGHFDQGIGETEDLLAVVNWVKQTCPQDEVWLAGFSFGAFVSARLATQIPVAQLVSVAPQISRFIETNLAPITCPWVLVQGEQDDIVSPQEVFAWIETLLHKPTVVRLPHAGHFFHGQLMQLREQLVAMLFKS